MEVDAVDRHEVPRHKLEKVICSLCGTEQDVSKDQYHCDDCGICRTGGQNFFHCKKCRCCYSLVLKDSHHCVEGAMHHNCPICFEYIFDSTKEVTALKCGHTIHLGCLNEMMLHFKFACPVCSKSVCDMSSVWEKLDKEIASTPMPEVYKNKTVWILCNDCGTSSQVCFHIVALKCLSCRSYNTRQTQEAPASCSPGVSELPR